MVAIIEVTDLPVAVQAAELVETMVAAANARASRVAPCLAGEGEDAPTADQLAEAKLVLIGAVVRWSETGSGSLQSQTVGPFGMTVDTRQKAGFNFWESEITALQALCSGVNTGVYSVSLAGDDPDDTWVPPYLGWGTPTGAWF